MGVKPKELDNMSIFISFPRLSSINVRIPSIVVFWEKLVSGVSASFASSGCRVLNSRRMHSVSSVDQMALKDSGTRRIVMPSVHRQNQGSLIK